MARPSKHQLALAEKITKNSPEPRFHKSDKIELMTGLNYYAANHEWKESKEWALVWIKKNMPELHKKLSGAKDWQFSNRGYVCRMIQHGFDAGESILENLRSFFTNMVPEKAEAAAPAAPKPVVKKHYINMSMCSLDDQMENAMAEKPVGKFEFSHTNAKDLEQVIAYCKKTLAEFNDLRDYYHLDTIVKLRPVLKSAVIEAEKFLDHISKNKTKIATAPKTINPAQMVKLVKYQKEEASLKLKSVSPAAVVGSKKCYMYDVSKRRIMLFVSNSAQGFMFTGTTLKNYDPTKCVAKTIRKPEKFFGDYNANPTMTGINTLFKGIAGKETAVTTGRINENIIFLKVSE